MLNRQSEHINFILSGITNLQRLLTVGISALVQVYAMAQGLYIFKFNNLTYCV